ncbi:MAG: hypothetical protein FWD94_07240, partial [Treponema sp.]|nr:hypothetical protein [Treponema sp.]
KNAEDYRKALEDCRNAVDMGMDFPDVRAYVSMILHKLGQSDKAIRECDDIIGQYPENAMAHAFRSLIYGDKGDGNRAEADRRKTLELDPELIWMFGKNGSLPEADG